MASQYVKLVDILKYKTPPLHRFNLFAIIISIEKRPVISAKGNNYHGIIYVTDETYFQPKGFKVHIIYGVREAPPDLKLRSIVRFQKFKVESDVVFDGRIFSSQDIITFPDDYPENELKLPMGVICTQDDKRRISLLKNYLQINAARLFPDKSLRLTKLEELQLETRKFHLRGTVLKLKFYPDAPHVVTLRLEEGTICKPPVLRIDFSRDKFYDIFPDRKFVFESGISNVDVTVGNSTEYFKKIKEGDLIELRCVYAMKYLEMVEGQRVEFLRLFILNAKCFLLKRGANRPSEPPHAANDSGKCGKNSTEIPLAPNYPEDKLCRDKRRRNEKRRKYKERKRAKRAKLNEHAIRTNGKRSEYFSAPIPSFSNSSSSSNTCSPVDLYHTQGESCPLRVVSDISASDTDSSSVESPLKLARSSHRCHEGTGPHEDEMKEVSFDSDATYFSDENGGDYDYENVMMEKLLNCRPNGI